VKEREEALVVEIATTIGRTQGGGCCRTVPGNKKSRDGLKKVLCACLNRKRKKLAHGTPPGGRVRSDSLRVVSGGEIH